MHNYHLMVIWVQQIDWRLDQRPYVTNSLRKKFTPKTCTQILRHDYVTVVTTERYYYSCTDLFLHPPYSGKCSAGSHLFFWNGKQISGLAWWGKRTFKEVEDAILLSAEYEYECSSLVAKYLSHGIKRFHSLSGTSQQLQALFLSKQNPIARFKTIKLFPISALCDFICCQLHLYWCLLMTA